VYKKIDRNAIRKKKHRRLRAKLIGNAQKPRLNVFRSNTQIYAQIIDDLSNKTLVAASSLDKSLKGELSDMTKKEVAKQVGKLVAQKAIEKGISEVVFDRGGYIYHGRIAALAEGAREGGLKF
jgi:large subunit ribosomal protein L18